MVMGLAFLFLREIERGGESRCDFGLFVNGYGFLFILFVVILICFV